MESRPPQGRGDSLVNRVPFFYGWVIVGVASIATFTSGPGQTYTAAIFIEPLIEELGWSRTLIASLYTAGSISAALAMIVMGRLMDRHGGRVMLVLVGILFGLAAFWMGKVNHPWQLYVGFAAIRTMGQGALTFIPTTLVALWFVKRRGKATAITSLGNTASESFYPPFLHLMIGRLGWRNTWSILGLGIWSVLLLPALLLVRRSPESIGLSPDGGHQDLNSQIDGKETSNVQEVQWTLGEALRTRSFWLLLFAGSAVSIISTGLGFNQISLLTSKGLDPGIAASVFSVMGPASLLSAFLAGYLADKIPNRYLLVAGQGVLALAMIWTFQISEAWHGFVYGLLMALGTRFILTINVLILPSYFGRYHIGSIRGIATSSMMVSAALGPLPFAFLYDLTNSYDTAILLFLTLPAVCALAALMARPPQKRGT